MPHGKGLTLFAGALLALGLGAAEANAQFFAPSSDYLYSVDIASDKEVGDPAADGDNVLDAGNIYQGAPDPFAPGLPRLWKDDDDQTDGVDTRSSVWSDYPFEVAPNVLGVPTLGTTPNVPNYEEHYDLDAEDQLAFDVTFAFPEVATDAGVLLAVEDPLIFGFRAGTGLFRANPGVPGNIVVSFDDDAAPGWTGGDVPVAVLPDRPDETFVVDSDYLPKAPSVVPPFLGPGLPMTPDKDEAALVLGPNPSFQQPGEDDDVDALDIIFNLPTEQTVSPALTYRYHSADHEAAGVTIPGPSTATLDPGDIYMTIEGVGASNYLPVFDDVLDFGIDAVPFEGVEDADVGVDIDAFEFVVLTAEEYQEAFGVGPGLPWVLAGLFSVDEDDPDTAPADESGGLSPYAIYLTNFDGVSVAITDNFGVFEDEVFVPWDIDAIAIPEPTSLALIGLGGLALLRRRRD